jgi:hypothetical protein
MAVITNPVCDGNPCMSSEPESGDITPGPQVSDALLAADVEPTADGGQRALLYPENRSGAELSTRWIAAEASVLVDLNEVQ